MLLIQGFGDSWAVFSVTVLQEIKGFFYVCLDENKSIHSENSSWNNTINTKTADVKETTLTLANNMFLLRNPVLKQ